MNDVKRIIIVALAAIVILVIGFAIKNHADVEGWKTAYKYNIAVTAEDKDAFNYDVDTHQGYVVTRADFKTNKGVKFDGQKETYTYVENVHEHYTQHTETYPCGTSKNPRTCTRTYYSWDRVGSEEKTAEKISLYGREYRTDTFDMSSFDKTLDGYHDASYYDRYYYRVVPLTFTASFLADTSDGVVASAFKGKVKLENKSTEKMIQDSMGYKALNNLILTIVAVLILIGLGIAAYAWVMADGKWSLHE